MQEAIDELPAECAGLGAGTFEMNSLSVLVHHTTGAERYWAGDVVNGEPSFRDREAEFRVKGLDAAAAFEAARGGPASL